MQVTVARREDEKCVAKLEVQPYKGDKTSNLEKAKANLVELWANTIQKSSRSCGERRTPSSKGEGNQARSF
jgi:hypothetical protein